MVSREIIEEYVRVGERLSTRFPAADLEPALQLVAASATLVSAPPLSEPVCADGDDDKFLACAVVAGAGYVVSGDRALPATSPYRNVIVIRPRDSAGRRDHTGPVTTVKARRGMSGSRLARIVPARVPQANRMVRGETHSRGSQPLMPLPAFEAVSELVFRCSRTLFLRLSGNQHPHYPEPREMNPDRSLA